MSDSVPFGSLLAKIIDNRGKTCPTSEDGIPLIATNCIKNEHLYPVYEKVRYVSQEIYDTWFRGHPEPGDLIFVLKGTPGRVNWVNDPVDFCIAQDMVALRVDESKVDPKYLFAVLRSSQIQQEIEGLHVGSLIPHFKKSDFDDLQIPLVEQKLQKYIGDTYFNLSLKIDLLHRQNKTLEAMAETLFRQWFIEDAKEDWEEVTLADVCTRITDGSHSSPASVEDGYPMASVKDMYDWGINQSTCRKISKEDYEVLVQADCKALQGDILIAKDGSYLKHVFLMEESLDVVLLSSIAMLRPNGQYHPMLLTLFLKLDSTHELMQNIVTGAVIPRIVLKDFRKFPIQLPPKDLQDKAVKIVKPIFEKCWENNRQIQTLENLRDTLLPKLMSGEVRVQHQTEQIA